MQVDGWKGSSSAREADRSLQPREIGTLSSFYLVVLCAFAASLGVGALSGSAPALLTCLRPIPDHHQPASRTCTQPEPSDGGCLAAGLLYTVWFFSGAVKTVHVPGGRRVGCPSCGCH
jgi:hypothetical protein